MRKLMILALALAAVAGCTPVRMAGDVAVGAGQLALGAVDVVL